MAWNLERDLDRLVNHLKKWTKETEEKIENDQQDNIKNYHQGYRDALDMVRWMLEITIADNK